LIDAASVVISENAVKVLQQRAGDKARATSGKERARSRKGADRGAGG
jgi:hypothetical protein